MTTKEKILHAMLTLPEEPTIEEAIDRLILLYKIERGLAQVDAGEVVSNEEAKARLAKWLK
jgi:predicted transcriptional regulator